MHSIDLDGVAVACTSRAALLEKFDQELGYTDRVFVGFYASLLFKAKADVQYRAFLQRSQTFVYPDGQAVVWACRLLKGDRSVERSATTDIWPDIVRLAVARDLPIILIGGSSTNVERAAASVRSLGGRVVFHSDGYWKDGDELSIQRTVRDHPGAVVFVGLGSGRQEEFAYSCVENFPDGSQSFFTVGGLFDHISGSVPRAPKLWQRMGLEWAWRSFYEPRRLARRYFMGNSYFIVRLLVNFALIVRVKSLT